MNVSKRTIPHIFFLLLAALSVNTARALNISFDGSTPGLISIPPAQQYTFADPFPVVSAPSGAHAYDFKVLWKSLGYPDLVHYGDNDEAVGHFGATEEQMMDLVTYTSKEDSFYKEINDYLRYYPEPYEWYGAGPEEAARTVKSLDGIFMKVPALPSDLVLFRGVDLKYRASKPYSIGEEFTDKGYVSTSTSYKVARHFAIEIYDNGTTPSRKAIFAIYFNLPEKGILVDQNEDEVLLKHGTNFKVMAKKDGVKKYDLYLLQGCQGRCSDALRPDVASFWSGLNIQD